MKNLFRILIVTMISLMAFQSRATHYLGGEITWECTSTNDYLFTVVIYKECGTGAATYVDDELHGPFGTKTMTQISMVEVSPTCLGGGSVACNVSARGEGAVQRFTFQVTIPKNQMTGIPPANGWDFYWQDQARPTNSLVNTNSGGYYLRAKMFPYTPPGSTTPNNANPCFDNSPTFSEVGSLAICAGSPFTYNHLVSDKDLDSLYVKFADPMQTATAPIAWTANYSSTSPYPSNLTNAANGPITLNGFTGAVSMDIQVATDGSYASCYEVSAYKCGVDANGNSKMIKVASVYRDVVIVVKNGCVTNNEPNAFIDTSTYKNIKQLGPKTYKTSVYPGDTINFRLSATDTDINPSTFLPQQIEFKAAGLQASDPMASGTGCDGVAPCAQFTPVAPQVGYVKALNNNIEFFWVPDCQHLNV
ncbi:hypothetical protein, partial [Owenweeksia hongkongensis]|uniref:hypothetical protein n=1 Tax=Owenweeksia hongkongensis TaxID=253245 RepID=UPI003A955BE6